MPNSNCWTATRLRSTKLYLQRKLLCGKQGGAINAPPGSMWWMNRELEEVGLLLILWYCCVCCGAVCMCLGDEFLLSTYMSFVCKQMKKYRPGYKVFAMYMYCGQKIETRDNSVNISNSLSSLWNFRARSKWSPYSKSLLLFQQSLFNVVWSGVV